MSTGYFDPKKKKYIVNQKEFTDQPSTLDYLKEGFEDQNTKAQLEALRRRRQSKAE